MRYRRSVSFVTSAAVRSHLVRALEADLVGPYEELEELEELPLDEEEEDDGELFLDEAGAIRRRRARWGPVARAGSNLRVQAREGVRAMVAELRPGLWVVAELDEATAQDTTGFLPLLAPVIIKTITRATKGESKPAKPVKGVPWAEAEDVEEALAGQCKCRRAR